MKTNIVGIIIALILTFVGYAECLCTRYQSE